jgi:hypothetical protein
MNQLRFVRDVIYRLKRNYGLPADFYKLASSSVDRATGKKTTVRLKASVARVIALPSRNQREFYYDLTFIASNKNFTYGGFVDTDERRFVVDRRDLRHKEFSILEVGQYMVYKEQRFDIKEVAEFEDSNCYGLICKQTVAAAPERVVEISVSHDLGIADGADSSASQIVEDDLGLTDDAEGVIQ